MQTPITKLMKDDAQPLIEVTHSQVLALSRSWYLPASKIYYNARPPDPQVQIDRAITLAHLSLHDSILEIGCEPGNAIVAFAQAGFSMICLEPNSDFFSLVQLNCASYPNVNVQTTSFEE